MSNSGDGRVVPERQPHKRRKRLNLYDIFPDLKPSPLDRLQDEWEDDDNYAEELPDGSQDKG